MVVCVCIPWCKHNNWPITVWVRHNFFRNIYLYIWYITYIYLTSSTCRLSYHYKHGHHQWNNSPKLQQHGYTLVFVCLKKYHKVSQTKQDKYMTYTVLSENYNCQMNVAEFKKIIKVMIERWPTTYKCHSHWYTYRLSLIKLKTVKLSFIVIII